MKYNYKIIIEIPANIMRDYKDTLKDIITKELLKSEGSPQIKGLTVVEKHNEVEWHQDCGVKTNQVKSIINKLN